MEIKRLKSFGASKKPQEAGVELPEGHQATLNTKSYCIMRSSKLREAKMFTSRKLNEPTDDDDRCVSVEASQSPSEDQTQHQKNLQSRPLSSPADDQVGQPNWSPEPTPNPRQVRPLSDPTNDTCQLAKQTSQTDRQTHTCSVAASRAPKLGTKLARHTLSQLVLVVVCIWLNLIDFNLSPTSNNPTRSIQSVNSQQYKPIWPDNSVRQEIFLLNLEDGYFGCQVNQSQEFLQLFELSRLCDGKPQCYLGTDEIEQSLKCKNRSHCGSFVNQRGQQESISCVNGVCLDGLCYCNDGFGGKSCDIPDENECKFRPCDVFAHCTNTMGSYYCSCYPGKCCK